MEPRKPQSPLRAGDSHFYPVTTIDQVIVDENSRLNDYSIISTREINTVLLADNWFANGDSYSQTITIEDLTEDYNVNVKIAYTNNLKKDLLISKASSYIQYAIQENNLVIFHCLEEKPVVDIPIELEVYL